MQAQPTAERLRDIRGRLRSPAAMPGYNAGRIPATKGQKFPPHPFTVEEIVQLLEGCRPSQPGRLFELSAMRLAALIVVLWRTGIRISEALALEPRDLDRATMAVTIRRGKGGKRRITVMDEWGWTQIQPWLDARENELPFGAVFCVLSGPTAGRPMSAVDARRQLRDAGRRAGLRRRPNPHNLRHTHAVDLWREGIDMYAVNRQFGHSRFDTTAIYLRSLVTDEVLAPIAQRKQPMMPLPAIAKRATR